MGGAPPDSLSLTTGIRSVLDRANHFKVGVWQVEHKRVTRGWSRRAWSALAVVSLALCTLPLGLPASAATPVCAVDLQAPMRGASAVAALGDELPTVAHAAGLSARSLEHALRTDRTLWVDECGRPYYVEPVDYAQATAEPVSAASDDALNVHSRPGSALTLFLDFDGHDVSATAWNATYGGDFTAEPYGVDFNPAFNDTELGRIESVWRRVAEERPLRRRRDHRGPRYHGDRQVVDQRRPLRHQGGHHRDQHDLQPVFVQRHRVRRGLRPGR